MGIEYRNNLNKVLSSSLLYWQMRIPRFCSIKVHRKKLKQYKDKEEVFEGQGHVIFMVDRSGSTEGDRAVWAESVGCCYDGYCGEDHRNFAFIPFDVRVGNVHHHVSYHNYSRI